MRLSALALSCALAALAAHAQAAAEDADRPCTIAGMNLAADPDFVAAVRQPGETQGPFGAGACKILARTEFQVDGARLRLNLSDFYFNAEGTIKMNVQMVEVQRREGDAWRSLGRIVLPPDPVDNELRFAPQVVKKDGAMLVRLAPRHGALYRIEDAGVSVLSAFGWRDGMQVALDLRDAGQNLSLDLEKMEGRIALVRDGKAASAFEPAAIGVARLAFVGGKLKAVATEVVKRREGEDQAADDARAYELERKDEVENRPEGVEPCTFGAWSNDRDPAGLNVRAEPSAASRILGVVPPPRVAPKKYEAAGPEPLKAEFRVIGYRDGWFLIDNIRAPGVAYDIPYPSSLPKAFKGRGWVAGNKVGAAPAFSGLPFGRLYAAPNIEARFEMRKGGTDAPFARVLSCTGAWGEVEAEGGRRGWVRGLCSNQVTTCS